MSSLRIGYLVQQFLPEVGAGPARVSEMAAFWRDAGARVTVITGMPNRPQGRIYPEYRGKLFMQDEWNGVRVLRSWLFARPNGGFATTLLNNATFMVGSAVDALARGGEFDVLIASSPPFFPHIAGCFVHHVTGVPLVLEIRDLWPDYLVDMRAVKSAAAKKVLFGVERALLRDATRVVVVTESFKNRVAAKGVPSHLIHVISNGVDSALYYPAIEPPPLDSLTRRDGEFLVGYLGNIGAGQALTTVVDAAAILMQRGAAIRLVIAGDGPDRAAVAAAARTRAPHIVTMEPVIPKEKTRAFYNACDACLLPLAALPILTETVPSKMFEIMACERPLVASVAGEAARIVERGGAGLVTPPGNAAALADTIQRMASLSAAERRTMGASGGAYVRRNYSRPELAARYLNILSAAASR